MTGNPRNQLTVVNLSADLDNPGVLIATLAHPLQCINCHHTGLLWQMPIATATTQPAPTTDTDHPKMTEPGS